jgi:hypothetical protein
MNDSFLVIELFCGSTDTERRRVMEGGQGEFLPASYYSMLYPVFQGGALLFCTGRKPLADILDCRFLPVIV